MEYTKVRGVRGLKWCFVEASITRGEGGGCLSLHKGASEGPFDQYSEFHYEW